MVENECVDALGTDAMRYVLEFKWRQFARRYFLREFLAYLCFLAFFTATVLSFTPEAGRYSRCCDVWRAAASPF